MVAGFYIWMKGFTNMNANSNLIVKAKVNKKR